MEEGKVELKEKEKKEGKEETKRSIKPNGGHENG